MSILRFVQKIRCLFTQYLRKSNSDDIFLQPHIQDINQLAIFSVVKSVVCVSVGQLLDSLILFNK